MTPGRARSLPAMLRALPVWARCVIGVAYVAALTVAVLRWPQWGIPVGAATTLALTLPASLQVPTWTPPSATRDAGDGTSPGRRGPGPRA